MPVLRPHLIVVPAGSRYNFSSRSGGGTANPPPQVVDRIANSQRILREVSEIAGTLRRRGDPVIDIARLPMTAHAQTGWGVSDSIPAPRKNEVLSVIGYAADARVNIALDPLTIPNFEAAAAKYVEHDAETHGRKPNHFNFFEARPTIRLTTVADLWASSLARTRSRKSVGGLVTTRFRTSFSRSP
jgi:hypothetical protein